MSEAALPAGFTVVNTEIYFIQDDLKDLFLYAGKNQPALYFDGRVRDSISSFAALVNQEAVIKGLRQLESDQKNGTFEQIKKSYDNQRGDYLFITLMKKPTCQ